MSLAAALTIAGFAAATCLIAGFALGRWVEKDNGRAVVYRIDGVTQEPRYNSRSRQQ